MIREKIKERMDYLGISQKMLCNDLGFVPANFNAFLHGRRTIQLDKLYKVLEYLRLGFKCPNSNEIYEPYQVTGLLYVNIKSSGMKVKDFADSVNISTSSISSFINGKRSISFDNLERLCVGLGIIIKPFKSY